MPSQDLGTARPRLRLTRRGLLLFLLAVLSTVEPRLVSGSSERTTPIVLEPRSEGIATYYSSGRPFGVFSIGGFSFIVSLESASVGQLGYSRLWVYCRNDSVRVADFDPSEWFTHTLTTDQQVSLDFGAVKWLKYTVLPLDEHVIPVSPPEPAWSLQNRVKSQASRAELWATLTAGIAGMATVISPTPDTRVSWTSNGAAGSGSMTVHDGAAKDAARVQAQASFLSSELDLIQASARADQESLNQSVLRRDTLVPGMAVAGYIYFPEIRSVSGRVLLERKDRPSAKVDTLLRPVVIDQTASAQLVRLKLPTGEAIVLRFVPVPAR